MSMAAGGEFSKSPSSGLSAVWQAVALLQSANVIRIHSVSCKITPFILHRHWVLFAYFIYVYFLLQDSATTYSVVYIKANNCLHFIVFIPPFVYCFISAPGVLTAAPFGRLLYSFPGNYLFITPGRDCVPSKLSICKQNSWKCWA